MARSNILWVEDEIGTIKGTLRRIKRHGFNVTVCNTVNSALAKLEKQHFDRIIIDYQIPTDVGEQAEKGSGLELLRRIITSQVKYAITPDKIMLLTAQMATFKRQMELSNSEGFMVLEKPGSLLKIESWIDLEGALA